MAAGFLNRRRALLLLGAGVFAAGKSLQGSMVTLATDDEVDLAKVPAKVKDAASKALPGATWTGASKWEEEGKTIYELEGKDASKTYVWADVTADGKINEVGSQITMDKAPEVVKAGLKAKMPRFQATSAYEARLDGKVIRYDFEGKRPRDKEDITVNVSPDGKKVEIEED